MFEDQKTNNQDSFRPAAPKPPVEDIFAAVDKPTPTPVIPNGTLPSTAGQTDSGKYKKYIIYLGAGLVAILLLAGVAFGALSLVKKKSATVKEPAKQTENIPPVDTAKEPTQNEGAQPTNSESMPAVNNENVAGETLSSSTVPTAPAGDLIDSDQDGLIDSEETALGTNINEPDSDNDGLFDREEIRVYKTNPMMQDTDGDSYLDGAEVKSGYNPNGPGKLYDINSVK